MAAIPLWGELNDTMWSDVFHVPAGKCAVLFATGLSSEKARVSAEEVKGPQMICIERVGLAADVGEPVAPCDGRCGPAASRDMDARLQFADLVESCATPWTLEPCRNIGIIGIPGAYRLRLNDATAIGTAQVYVEFYDSAAIAPQVYGAFFS